MSDAERSKGGGYMAKKNWRLFHFIIEVAIESPGDLDEYEAAEDAADFCTALSRTAGRTGRSFASVTRIDEVGRLRPPECPVVIREYPSGNRIKLTLPRGIDSTKNNYEKKPIKKALKRR